MSLIQKAKNFYHYLSARLHSLPFYTGLFNDVSIETTTICNRRCHYCPQYTIGSPGEKMEESLFYKIVDALKTINFAGNISPSLYGEPLTDERLLTFVKYIRTNLPKTYIRIYTNGDFLTLQKYLELKKAGVDIFEITQHSREPSATLVNTLTCIKKNYRKLYTVKYNNYYDEYYHKKNVNALLFNRGGLVDVTVKKRTYCDLPHQLVIDYQGNVILCCEDYESSIIFGNVRERKILDIWYEKNYMRIRKMIHKGIWPYEICRKCTGN